MQNDLPIRAANELFKLIDELEHGYSTIYARGHMKQVAEDLIESHNANELQVNYQIAQLRAELLQKDEEMNEFATQCDKDYTRLAEKNNELELDILDMRQILNRLVEKNNALEGYDARCHMHQDIKSYPRK